MKTHRFVRRSYTVNNETLRRDKDAALRQANDKVNNNLNDIYISLHEDIAK